MTGAATVSEKRTYLTDEVSEIIALTLIVFLVIRFAAQSFRVDGDSGNSSILSHRYLLPYIPVNLCMF